MGYLRHETIIVSGLDAKGVEAARAVATEVFARHGLTELVSPIVPHAINGGAAFFVARLTGRRRGGVKARLAMLRGASSSTTSTALLDTTSASIGRTC